MANKQKIIEIYTLNCNYFEKQFKEEICDVWIKILGSCNYNDKMIEDCFNDHIQDSSKPIMLNDFKSFRDNNYFKYGYEG